MFDDRNKSFLRRTDLAADYHDREAFAIELRKKKRYNLIDQKRQKNIKGPNESPSSILDLDLMLGILGQAETFKEKLNLWNSIANSLFFYNFQIGSQTFSNLLTAICRYLDLKYSAEILEIVTFILIKISNLEDSVLSILDFQQIIHQLLMLFDFPNEKVQENAIFVLANFFATNLNHLHDQILESNFWKKLRKVTFKHELFPVIAWAARNASCLENQMNESFCRKASDICKIILTRPGQDDETLKYALSTLAQIAKNGGKGFEILYQNGNIEHVFKLFNVFPGQALRTVGFILMKNPERVSDLIEFNLLNHLEDVIGSDVVNVKAKSWWVLEKLCKTGVFAIKHLVKHKIFKESLDVPRQINEESRIIWSIYVETLLKNCEEELRFEIMTEELAQIVFEVCSESSKRLKIQCSNILWMFIDTWGNEKFFMTEVGVAAQSLIEDDEFNIGSFSDYPVMTIIDKDL
jgi:hypothetical protein